MKLTVEFPSVAYRQGGEAVVRLAQAIEEIGYAQLDMFDHVVMGHPTETRDAPRYPPRMPIMEALVLLGFVASATRSIGLGTEVLVLPQRQPVLVAKQVSTLDMLSGGRVRLGVGTGWQSSEYEALGVPFRERGRRLEEAIELLRECWRDDPIDHRGDCYSVTAMAMEPKPPQGGRLPIWIGGAAPAALERVGRLADGWLAPALTDPDAASQAKATIRAAAEAAGRDPEGIGYQMMLTLPPTDAASKAFYADLDRVEARAAAVAEMGFEWGAVNATAIFQAGQRSVDAIIDTLGAVYQRVQRAAG